MNQRLTRVVVGSGSGKLLSFEFDGENGRLRPTGEVTSGSCPSFVALHPSGRIAYVANEGGDEIAVIDLERQELVGRAESGGGGPAYVSLLSDTTLACANYGGGTVALFAIAENGLGIARRQVVAIGPNPHAIVADPSGRFAIVPALGADAVFVARLRDGALEEPKPFALPKGSGPRHIAFHPGGTRAYLVAEHTSELFVLDWDADQGTLSEAGRASLLPDGVRVPRNTAADVHVHPNGTVVYTSNRGHDSIAMFRLTSGLEPAGHLPTGGSTPRNFCLHSSGSWLLAANLRSHSIKSFAVDGSGACTELALNEGIAEPFWVGFVERPG